MHSLRLTLGFVNQRIVMFIERKPSALKKDYITLAFQVSESLMRCLKELHFLNYCSHKINKFLIQNIDYKIYIRNHAISCVSFSNSYISCQAAVKKLDVSLSRAKFISVFFYM